MQNESFVQLIQQFILHFAQVQGISKKEAIHRLIKQLKRMQ